MKPAAGTANENHALTSFRVAIAGATLLMVGLSGPLWVSGGDFPRVPFVGGWPEPVRWLAWCRLGALVATLLAVASGRGGRPVWGISLGLLVWTILGDQNRLQPWVQQYLAVALAFVVFRPTTALAVARWYAVVLYAASGLSKLDPSFVDELGRALLATSGQLVGLEPELWPSRLRAGATLAMPLAEIAIAVALVGRRTRWIGLVGSVLQHLITIMILGPWGLDHSLIVLVWNGAMIGENLALFGGPSRHWLPRELVIRGVVPLVLALVVGERWGWVDSWPGHALYASHAERARIAWPETTATALPPEIQHWLGPADGVGGRWLDLTGWSRAERGVPVYPQNRVACGVAEALVERYAPATGPPVRLILLDRAGVSRKSVRRRVECVNLPAIRRRGDRFRINAHPAPG